MKNDSKLYNINLDFLKIISMFMVVIIHSALYGKKYIENINFNLFFIFFKSFSIAAVNCFVLVTSYNMCLKQYNLNKKDLFKYYKRIISLWFTVMFYSFGIYLVLTLISNNGIVFSKTDLIQTLLPIMTNQYWFFTIYFLLIVLLPFLNFFVNSIDKNQHKILIMVLSFLFCIIPTINIYGDSFNTHYGYGIIWFIVLYFTASYIRKYGLNKRKYGLIYIGCSLTIYLLYIVNYKFLSSTLFIGDFIKTLTVGYYNSIIVFVSSVSLFCYFLTRKNRKFEIRHRESIHKFAGLTFGVYLIHENNYFKDILWYDIVCLQNNQNNWITLIFRWVCSIVLIYIIGIIVEFIRSTLYKKITKFSFEIVCKKNKM